MTGTGFDQTIFPQGHDRGQALVSAYGRPQESQREYFMSQSLPNVRTKRAMSKSTAPVIKELVLGVF